MGVGAIQKRGEMTKTTIKMPFLFPTCPNLQRLLPHKKFKTLLPLLLGMPISQSQESRRPKPNQESACHSTQLKTRSSSPPLSRNLSLSLSLDGGTTGNYIADQRWWRRRRRRILRRRRRRRRRVLRDDRGAQVRWPHQTRSPPPRPRRSLLVLLTCRSVTFLNSLFISKLWKFFFYFYMS